MTQLRAYDFIVGVEASAQPDAGTPSLPNDLITLSYLETYAAERRKLVGTYLAPIEITAGTAIDPTIEANIDEYLMFIVGDGAAQDMSANPQVVAPGRAGIRVTLVLADAALDEYNITLENGTGLALNGPCELADKESITLISIDANTWQEESRS